MELRTFRTQRLDLGYLEAGPAHGPPVLLLHGFPDDAWSWSTVAAGLARAGRRVIAPFVRGCGPSAFQGAGTPRAGDFAALGQDALDLVDGLDLRGVTVVGHDWGSPTAEIVAMRRPERVERLVKLNWYGVYSMNELAKATGFAYPQMQTLWYVWMLNTPLGEMVLAYDRAGFARALWTAWSPTWDEAARDAALAEASRSFEGEDWKRVTLSAYRSSITPAETDPADDELREALKDPPPVRCPVTILVGADDGVERTPLTREVMERSFPAGATVRSLPGVGHFPHREAPEPVLEAILA